MLATRSPDELTNALDDSSPEVARAAVRRLAEISRAAAAGPLRARLLVADLSLIADIAGALPRIGDAGAVDVALAGLTEQPYTRRLAAARALGALGDPRAAGALRTALRDDVAGVRTASLDALAKLGRAAGAAEDCARLLSDPVPQVRIAAVRALSRITARPGSPIAHVNGSFPPSRLRAGGQRVISAQSAPRRRSTGHSRPSRRRAGAELPFSAT